MTPSRVRGTEGYARDAEALIPRWERISAAEHHGPVLHLIPHRPCNVLDIGAGTGRDAAWFAAMGHSVVAVEPLDPFRQAGLAQHRSDRIAWRDDSLPDLATLTDGPTFDLVMLTAVWTHLDAGERRRAMRRVASLLGATGVMIMSLRHGPVPAGRRMFAVGAEETIELASAQGLHLRLRLQTDSLQAANRLAGITWTRLAFAKTEAEP